MEASARVELFLGHGAGVLLIPSPAVPPPRFHSSCHTLSMELLICLRQCLYMCLSLKRVDQTEGEQRLRADPYLPVELLLRMPIMRAKDRKLPATACTFLPRNLLGCVSTELELLKIAQNCQGPGQSSNESHATSQSLLRRPIAESAAELQGDMLQATGEKSC